MKNDNFFFASFFISLFLFYLFFNFFHIRSCPVSVFTVFLVSYLNVLIPSFLSLFFVRSFFLIASSVYISVQYNAFLDHLSSIAYHPAFIHLAAFFTFVMVITSERLFTYWYFCSLLYR